MKETIVTMARKAAANPTAVQGGRDAFALFRGYVPLMRATRVPGMETALRLAIRVDRGMTVEQAAAREYAYRWHLTLDNLINRLESRSSARGEPIWGVPHLLGM